MVVSLPPHEFIHVTMVIIVKTLVGKIRQPVENIYQNWWIIVEVYLPPVLVDKNHHIEW